MKVLVTGAFGFVGTRVCTQLNAEGHTVIRVGHQGRQQVDGSLYCIDLGDTEEFAKLGDISGIDAIVNCAGIAHRFGRVSKQLFQRVNVDGVRNLANFAAAGQIGRFVQLSSVLVYGRTRSKEPVDESHALAPHDNYAVSKLDGERAAATVCNKAGIKLTILRPAPIIGEGSSGNVSRLIRAVDSRRFVNVGNGENERSFVYVGDVARAVSTVLESDHKNSTFNVVGGSLPVRDLVRIIAERLGTQPPSFKIPRSIAKIGLSAARPLAIVPAIDKYKRSLETWLADAVYSGEALHELGFRPMTGIEEGLNREVDHYLDHKCSLP